MNFIARRCVTLARHRAVECLWPRLTVVHVRQCLPVQLGCNLSTSSYTLEVQSVLDAVREIKEVPSTSGTASDIAAENFRRAYIVLDKPGRQEALRAMATNFCVKPDELAAKCAEFLDTWRRNHEPSASFLKKLENALRPGYKKVFFSVSYLQGGVKFLVDFRSDLADELSAAIKSGNAEVAQDLRDMDHVLYELMTVWFGRGFLSLQRVKWDSPCSMLEKIVEGEAVHPVRHWLDLKRRLGMYRRVFAFNHQSMPDEPLIVIYVALMPSITASIKEITDAYRDDHLPEMEEEPKKVQAAIFYSISALQRGLRGVELGGYLIKKVVDRIRWEYPELQMFSTLSPIPGFRAWLLVRLHETARGSEPDLLTEQEVEAWKEVFGDGKEKEFWRNVIDGITKSTWYAVKDGPELLRPALMRLCARYLYVEKHRGYALDPVANFHLRNGAVLWRINYLGDTSLRGLQNSCGMMVNYRYFLETVRSNSERYIEHKVVAVKDDIAELSRPLA